MTDLTIPGLLAARAAAGRDRPFLHVGDEVWTYGRFAAEVAGAAAGLAAAGVGPGARVALVLPNSPELLVAWFALARLRAVAVPINTAFRAREMAYPLAHAEPALVVAGRELRGTLEAALAEAGTPRRPVAWVEAGGLPFRAAPGAARDPEPAGPDDVACFIYTSGTAGPPKAVMQTHRSYVLTGEGFAYWLGLGPDDRLLTPLPLFHINAQAYSAMGALAAGGGLVLLPRFSASRFWEQVRRYRATQANVIGSMLLMLWKQPPSPLDREHELRVLYSAPVPAEICRGFEERFGVALIQGFGMSECTFGLIQSRAGSRKPGGMGRPRELPARGIRNEARVVDDEGRACPPGVPGELLLRNTVMMAGYFRDPERTAEVIGGDGWLRTGDVVYRDDDGELFFVDRKKDVIRRRGENVSPAEVEAVLNAHPGVLEAAVIGVPSPFTEEDIVAYVVPREPGSATVGAICEWCGERLAPFKVPAEVRFVDALPKTPTEKVKRAVLRAWYAGAGPAAGA